MKKVIITIILASTVGNLFGQFFFLIEPMLLRTGVMYNMMIDEIPVGVYTKTQYRYFWSDDLSGHHIKQGAGICINPDKDFRGYVGLDYNHYWNMDYNHEIYDIDRIKRISLTLGVSCTDRRFTLLFLTDLFNWSTTIGISYDLMVKQKIYNRKYLIK